MPVATAKARDDKLGQELLVEQYGIVPTVCGLRFQILYHNNELRIVPKRNVSTLPRHGATKYVLAGGFPENSSLLCAVKGVRVRGDRH